MTDNSVWPIDFVWLFLFKYYKKNVKQTYTILFGKNGCINTEILSGKYYGTILRSSLQGVGVCNTVDNL
jgi:hypothetical protein